MKLRQSERAQVVELLRCAHDMKSSGVAFPFGAAVGRLSVTERVYVIAIEAVESVNAETGEKWWNSGCLEAALRVELGELP